MKCEAAVRTAPTDNHVGGGGGGGGGVGGGGRRPRTLLFVVRAASKRMRDTEVDQCVTYLVLRNAIRRLASICLDGDHHGSRRPC